MRPQCFSMGVVRPFPIPYTYIYNLWSRLARPQAPRCFQHCTRKEGEPGKTYHMCDIRWNQLPYMAQQEVGQNQG